MNKKIINKRSDDKKHIFQQFDALEKVIETTRKKGQKAKLAAFLFESAQLSFELNHISESEDKYKEALTIYRKLAAKNPSKYEPEVAETFKALAFIHHRIDMNWDAWQEYLEALTTYCKLAEEDFCKYKNQIVDVLKEAITLYRCFFGMPLEDFDIFYEMVLKVYHKFVLNCPDEYESIVAEALIVFFAGWRNDSFCLLDSEKKLREEKTREIEKIFVETVDIYRRSSLKNPEKYEIKLAKALQNQAFFYHEIKKTQEAQRIYKKSLSIFRRFAENGPDMYKVELAEHLKKLAENHQRSDKKNAELELSEALDIYRKLAEKHPDSYESKIAETLLSLSELHEYMGKKEISDREFNEAIEMDLRITEKHPNSYKSNIPEYLYRYVEFQLMIDYNSGLQTYEEWLEIYRRYAKIDPVGYEYAIAGILYSISDFCSREKEYDEEEKALTEALKVYRGFSEVYYRDSTIAFTLKALAKAHDRLGDIKKAEKEYTEALQIYHGLLKRDSAEYEAAVAQILLDLALLHYESDKDDEIEKDLKQALSIYRKYLKKKSDERFNPYEGKLEDDIVYTQIFLGSTQIKLNKYREAEKNLEDALQNSRRLLRKDSSVKFYKRYLASTFLYLSIAHYEIGKHDNAEIEYKKALKIFRLLAKLDPDNYTPVLASALRRLANVHRNFGMFRKANREYKEYLTLDSQISDESIEKYKSSAMITLYNELSAKHANTERKSSKVTWR